MSPWFAPGTASLNPPPVRKSSIPLVLAAVMLLALKSSCCKARSSFWTPNIAAILAGIFCLLNSRAVWVAAISPKFWLRRVLARSASSVSPVSVAAWSSTSALAKALPFRLWASPLSTLSFNLAAAGPIMSAPTNSFKLPSKFPDAWPVFTESPLPLAVT